MNESAKKSRKSIKNDIRNEEKDNKLIESLKKDEKLNEDREYRMHIISMATMFLEDFSDNIYKTSIEMNLKIPYFSVDAWKDFLNYPIVRKYIKSFRDEKIDMVADQGLAEGDKGAVSIKRAIQANGPQVNNSNIVLIRLPEKKEWE